MTLTFCQNTAGETLGTRIQTMKFVFALSLQFLLLIPALFATTDVQTITVTTPVLHTWDTGGVKFAKIPHTGWDIDNPFYYSELYAKPFLVLEKKKHLKQDINLISVFQLRIHSDLRDGITTIYISTANATKPKQHPLSVEEVIKYAKEAVRSDFPDKDEFVVRVTDKSVVEIFDGLRKTATAEQAGAEQPATALESKPEGQKKPKPESEGRSQ